MGTHWSPRTTAIISSSPLFLVALLLAVLDRTFCEWGLSLPAFGGPETLVVHSCFALGASFG